MFLLETTAFSHIESFLLHGLLLIDSIRTSELRDATKFLRSLVCISGQDIFQSLNTLKLTKMPVTCVLSLEKVNASISGSQYHAFKDFFTI